jgi:hypothetical protein
MPNIAGNLLLNRRRLTLPFGATDIDTGLQQDLRAFPVGEPTDDPGVNEASRIMVCPMAPVIPWFGITHGEPYLDPTTKTVHVAFFNPGAPATINVLFWNPHSIICPLDADPYASSYYYGPLSPQ